MYFRLFGEDGSGNFTPSVTWSDITVIIYAQLYTVRVNYLHFYIRRQFDGYLVYDFGSGYQHNPFHVGIVPTVSWNVLQFNLVDVHMSPGTTYNFFATTSDDTGFPFTVSYTMYFYDTAPVTGLFDHRRDVSRRNWTLSRFLGSGNLSQGILDNRPGRMIPHDRVSHPRPSRIALPQIIYEEEKVEDSHENENHPATVYSNIISEFDIDSSTWNVDEEMKSSTVDTTAYQMRLDAVRQYERDHPESFASYLSTFWR